MKRTLSVTLVVCGLMFAALTFLLSRQQRLLVAEKAQAADERDRVLAEAPPTVSLPGEQGGSGAASPTPADEGAPNARPPVSEDKLDGDQKESVAPPSSEKPGELKLFRLKNADASEAFRAIQPLLSREAKVSVDQRTNSLIVSANADNLIRIQALLIALDAEPTRTGRPPAEQGGARPPSQRLPMTGQPPGILIDPKDDQDVAMDREAKQLAARVRAAKEPEKSKLRAELDKLTEKHFEHRQQRRNAEIADMADRVDKLRVAHHRRQEIKPDILKRRLADLLDEDNELKWDDAPNQPAQNRVSATGTGAVPSGTSPDMSSAAHLSLPPTAKVIEAFGGPDSDLVRLHGVWGIESVEPGDKLPPGLTLRIDASKAEGLIIPDRPGLDGRHVGDVMFRLGIQSNKVWYTINESTKRIDIMTQGDGEPIKRVYGIYMLDHNKLTMLFGPPDEARPQYFQTKLQPKHVRLQLSRRPKPVDAAAVPALPSTEDPLGTAENGDPRQSTILAAHRKAAEARLKFAKFELDRVVESNRQVPGSVSSAEVEKLKTNVAVAEAELELVLAGGDPRASKAREAPLSEPVAAAKLQRAEVALKSAKQEFDRLQKLIESKAVSQAEVDRVAARLEELKATVEVSKAELEEARRAGQPKGQYP